MKKIKHNRMSYRKTPLNEFIQLIRDIKMNSSLKAELKKILGV